MSAPCDQCDPSFGCFAEPVRCRKRSVVRIDMNGHDITADELTVVRRCIERLKVLRAATAAGTAELGRPWSELDEALRLELTHVRMQRERPRTVDAGPVTLSLGDATWHDGPGWYYTIDDYPDEGSCGAFATRDQAIEHARAAGHTLAGDADEIAALDLGEAGA